MKKCTKKNKTNVLAASHIGKIHKNSQPNEDAYYYKLLDCGTFVGAVADGAGTSSAPFASVGSKEAVLKIVACLEAYRGVWPEPERNDAGKEWKQIMQSCFMETQMHLKAFASNVQSLAEHLENVQYSTNSDEKDSNGSKSASELSELRLAFSQNKLIEMLLDKGPYPESAFASTLLVVVTTPEWIAYGQIGDGGIVICTQSDNNTTEQKINFKRLTFDLHEIANHTVFLTSKNSLRELQFGFKKDSISGIVLFSDGLERIIFNYKENEPRRSFLQPLFQIVSESNNQESDSRELEKYLASDSIQSKTFDDTTIIVTSICVKGDEYNDLKSSHK